MTVSTHMSRISYTLRALHWIPQALTCELKHVHLSMCLQSVPKLRADAHDNWWHLVTEDESRFYHEYVPRGI
jgi:hypothetical protein